MWPPAPPPDPSARPTTHPEPTGTIPVPVTTVMAAAALALALAFGRALALHAGPVRLDDVGWRVLARVPLRTAEWQLVSRLGGGRYLLVLALLGAAMVALSWSRRIGWTRALARAALVPVAAVATGVVLEAVLKPGIGRWWGHALAYPSGHAGGTAAAVAAAWFLTRGRGPRLAVLAVLAPWSLAVGIAMAAKHSHYPTDIVGGWVCGAAVAILLVQGAIALVRDLRGADLDEGRAHDLVDAT